MDYAFSSSSASGIVENAILNSTATYVGWADVLCSIACTSWDLGLACSWSSHFQRYGLPDIDNPQVFLRVFVSCWHRGASQSVQLSNQGTRISNRRTLLVRFFQFVSACDLLANRKRSVYIFKPTCIEWRKSLPESDTYTYRYPYVRVHVHIPVYEDLCCCDM